MYSDGPPFPTLPSHDDAEKPKQLSARLLILAKKRNDNSATSDTYAAFKEGVRSPVAGASE